MFKFVRGGAGVALLASGLGVVGGLGVGLATSGTASAAGPTISGKWSCATPLGEQKVTTKIQDQNTIPATMPKTSVYQNHVSAHFIVPATLIHLIPATITQLPVTAATLDLAKTGFTGPSALTLSHTVLVTITTTTRLHGGTVTFTYAPATFTQSLSSGTSTLHATELQLTIVVPLTCYPPGVTIVFTKKTVGTGHTTTLVTNFTKWTTTGSTTQGAIDSTTATAFVGPLALTTPSGALPQAQATVHYSQPTYWTSSGGKGTNVWTETGSVDGLTFSGTGAHASLSGTPTAAGTFPFTVTVTTKTGAHVTHTFTLTVKAAPATPIVLQTFQLTVIGGSLTMTCAGGTPPVTLPIETQHTVHNCTKITLGTQKLNEQADPRTAKMNTLYISTARGGPTDGWSLVAVMVPSSSTLTHNTFCNTVQGFCNATTTNPAKLATVHTHTNTTITAKYLFLAGYTCKPQRTTHSSYYNVNPTPTTTPGHTQTVGTYLIPSNGLHSGLKFTMTMCTAAAGVSGGEFIVKTGTYTLLVPPNVYAGKYFGTVQYTLQASI
jgi:hypothetical protein